MSSNPTRSSGSLVSLRNESSNEDTREHNNNDNNNNNNNNTTVNLYTNEIVPYRSPSTSSESGLLVDKEASLYVRTWVQQHYIAERDHNVPRRDMFEHYKGCCIAAQMTPVNSATFGKLLRNVFPDLKTRRLGVRGQSKYHYCGIRLRSGESEIELSNHLISPPNLNERLLTGSTTTTESYAREGRIAGMIGPPPPSSSSSSPPHTSPLPPAAFSSSHSHPSLSSLLHNQASSSSNITATTASTRIYHLPKFSVPIITSYRYNPNIDSTITAFTTFYEAHCHELLKLVVNGHVEQQQVAHCLETFYKTMPDQYKELIDTVPEVCDSIWRWDCTLYDTIIIEALPDIHYTTSPEMMRALRRYTKDLSDYLKKSLVNYPEHLYRKKSDVARIFTAKFRRQLSLNQAAQAAASILASPTPLAMMRCDWNNIDFDSVIDQTLWVCDYNANYINRILRESIHELIFKKPNLPFWMQWASSLIESCLKDHLPSQNITSEEYLTYAKSVITKWNLYTSMIIKDLALQQAKSFSFYFSLKIFLDDYIVYLVEENIAQVNHNLVQSANLLPLPPDAFFAPSTSRSEEESSA